MRRKAISKVEFGRAVTYFRKEAGYSTQQLADEAGYTLEFINGVEQGWIDPTIGVMSDISTALNIDLFVLVFAATELEYAKPKHLPDPLAQAIENVASAVVRYTKARREQDYQQNLPAISEFFPRP